MTNELVLERTSNLVMPTHYVELDMDEMSYVIGGISTSAVAAIIDVGLFAICGAINLSIKMAGWMCKGAAKNYIKKKAPTWAKTLLKISGISAAIQGIGGNLSTVVTMFNDVSVWIDRIATALSIGGIIATILDVCDGSWDGQICF